jgi:hypothetical protein
VKCQLIFLAALEKNELTLNCTELQPILLVDWQSVPRRRRLESLQVQVDHVFHPSAPLSQQTVRIVQSPLRALNHFVSEKVPESDDYRLERLVELAGIPQDPEALLKVWADHQPR